MAPKVGRIGTKAPYKAETPKTKAAPDEGARQNKGPTAKAKAARKAGGPQTEAARKVAPPQPEAADQPGTLQEVAPLVRNPGPPDAPAPQDAPPEDGTFPRSIAQEPPTPKADAHLPAAYKTPPCHGGAVGEDLSCEPRDYRLPYQLGDPSADTGTLLKLARKLGEPVAAVEWCVSKEILYLPPKCKAGHAWRCHSVARRGSAGPGENATKVSLMCAKKGGIF